MKKKSPPPPNWASPRDDGPMPATRTVTNLQLQRNRLRLQAMIEAARTAVRLGPHGERLGTVERRRDDGR